MGHHGHVLNLIILWRVHGEDFSIFDSDGLLQGPEATQEFRFDTKLMNCSVFIHICVTARSYNLKTESLWHHGNNSYFWVEKKTCISCTVT